jgi:hypothetical protein
MRTEKFRPEDLEELLFNQKIVTMDEMKHALGTEVDQTVFRKLRQLDYITSYSHRGRYYTLKDTPRFDELGLWSYRSVFFSRYGTLMATIEAFVHLSDAGYYATELEEILQVRVKNTLLSLIDQRRLEREKVSGRYLYCSQDPGERKQQIQVRKTQESEPSHGRLPIGIISDELKAAIVLFASLLDEQQRRLYAGLEALKWGYGGDRKMAELLGVDVSTVAKGRQQLMEQDVELGRTRRAGGGRKPVEKKLQSSSRGSKS